MIEAGGFPGYYESECAAQAGSFQGLLGHGQIPLSVSVAYSIANSPQQAAPIPPTVHWLCEFENHDIIDLTLDIPQKPPNNPTDSTYPTQGHQPQGLAAHGLASSRQVRPVYLEFIHARSLRHVEVKSSPSKKATNTAMLAET